VERLAVEQHAVHVEHHRARRSQGMLLLDLEGSSVTMHHMEMRTFGKTGLKVAPLGFGGGEIGFEGVTQDIAGKLLNEALDAGLNVIDTAECYMDSEELIGRAVAQRRKDYHLFTKTGHPDGFAEPKWDRA